MTYPSSPFDALTTDIGIKNWALHAAKDGKRMRYYLYLSSNGDVLKDINGMFVRVDMMGETCDTPEQAIEVGYLEFSRECQRRVNRVFPQKKPVESPKDLHKLSAEDILKEIGL